MQGVCLVALASSACKRSLSAPTTTWIASDWSGASCGLSSQHSWLAPAATPTGGWHCTQSIPCGSWSQSCWPARNLSTTHIRRRHCGHLWRCCDSVTRHVSGSLLCSASCRCAVVFHMQSCSDLVLHWSSAALQFCTLTQPDVMSGCQLLPLCCAAH